MAGTRVGSLPAASSVAATDGLPISQTGVTRLATVHQIGLEVSDDLDLVRTVNGQAGPTVSLDAADVGAVAETALGAASGVATLDSGSKLVSSQIPTSVTSGIAGAVSDAAAAQTAASAAQTAASGAQTAAAAAQAAVVGAVGDAAAALTAAAAAQTAASSAQGTASAANTTAGTANTNASAALTAANTAATAAGTAQTAANNAQTTANTANTAAGNAATAAAAAQTTANAAIPATQKGAASGVATLDSSSHVPAAQLALAILASALGAANGAASLDGSGHVPAPQLANALLASALGAVNGVAPLDAGGLVPAANLPYSGVGAVTNFLGRTGGILALGGDYGRTGVMTLSRPSLASFSTIYGALATSTAQTLTFTDQTDSYLLSLLAPATTSGSTFSPASMGFFKTIQGGATQVVACFEWDPLANGGYSSLVCGIGLLDTALGTAGKGGMVDIVGPSLALTPPKLIYGNTASPNSTITDNSGAANLAVPGGPGRVWVKITGMTSATRNCFISYNGRDWSPLFTVSGTNVKATNPTHVGFMLAESLSGTYTPPGTITQTSPITARLLHFVES